MVETKDIMEEDPTTMEGAQITMKEVQDFMEEEVRH